MYMIGERAVQCSHQTVNEDVLIHTLLRQPIDTDKLEKQIYFYFLWFLSEASLGTTASSRLTRPQLTEAKSTNSPGLCLGLMCVFFFITFRTEIHFLFCILFQRNAHYLWKPCGIVAHCTNQQCNQPISEHSHLESYHSFYPEFCIWRYKILITLESLGSMAESALWVHKCGPLFLLQFLQR